MNSLAAIGLGLAGALAGIPLAAIAFSTTASGPVRLPARWWIGGPARLPLVFGTATGAGAAAATVGAVVPPPLALPAFWLFAVLGVGLAIIDVRCRRLPHRLTGALFTSSGLCFAVAAVTGGGVQPLMRAVGAGVATAAILLVVALALPGQLGLGDVLFASAITLSLGWLSLQAAVIGLFAGLVTQGGVVLAAKVFGRDQATFPMGPALFMGWLIAVAFMA